MRRRPTWKVSGPDCRERVPPRHTDNGPEGAGVPPPDALPMPYRGRIKEHGCVLAVLKSTDVFWVLVFELPGAAAAAMSASLTAQSRKTGRVSSGTIVTSRALKTCTVSIADTIWVKPGLLQGVPTSKQMDGN